MFLIKDVRTYFSIRCITSTKKYSLKEGSEMISKLGRLLVIAKRYLLVTPRRHLLDIA